MQRDWQSMKICGKDEKQRKAGGAWVVNMLHAGVSLSALGWAKLAGG